MFYITDSPGDLVIRVDGLPPAKGGPSVLSSAHRHHDRALKLLTAAAEALPPDWAPLREAVGLTLIVSAPTEAPPGDPTNFLGGVADVLQRKVPNDVLGELAFIVVYENDLQLRSVEYRQRLSTEVSYELCIRGLGGPDLVTPRVAAVPAIDVSVEFLDADELALAFVNVLLHPRRREPRVATAAELIQWLSVQHAIPDDVRLELLSHCEASEAASATLYQDAATLATSFHRVFLGERRADDVALLTRLRRESARFESLDLDAQLDLPLANLELDGHSLGSVWAPLMRSTLRILMPSIRRRIRVCADEDCRRLFLDRTKNGTKAWCSMSCGSRAKVRTWRMRHAKAKVEESAIGYRFN